MQSFHLPSFSDWSVQAPEAPRPSAVMPHFAYTEIFQGWVTERIAPEIASQHIYI